MPTQVTAVFDIGKTNKKFFLFDKELREVKQEYTKIPLIKDDDGYPCEDLDQLTRWIRQKIDEICGSADYQLEGLNFSTYGASLVHLDAQGNPITPLYNYLKDFPEGLLQEFFEAYPEEANNLETASPTLGMLNSGLQLYWLKKTKPEKFKQIRYSLHLPQYVSYLFTGEYLSEPTSIGCHTRLWDYEKNDYHDWVKKEELHNLFPKIVPTTHVAKKNICGNEVRVGVGIHDSSSALASYLVRAKEPFLLVSTGTWSITLNPFTEEALTFGDLQNDCLNYLTIHGKPVKASRFFIGNELDHQLAQLNKLFGKSPAYYKSVEPDEEIIHQIVEGKISNIFYPATIQRTPLIASLFKEDQWEPETHGSFEEAYHQLIWGLVRIQVASLLLAKGNSPITKVFVDGGFVHNKVFIRMLNHFLEGYSLEFSDFPLGSAYGAALMINANDITK